MEAPVKLHYFPFLVWISAAIVLQAGIMFILFVHRPLHVRLLYVVPLVFGALFLSIQALWKKDGLIGLTAFAVNIGTMLLLMYQTRVFQHVIHG